MPIVTISINRMDEESLHVNNMKVSNAKKANALQLRKLEASGALILRGETKTKYVNPTATATVRIIHWQNIFVVSC